VRRPPSLVLLCVWALAAGCVGGEPGAPAGRPVEPDAATARLGDSGAVSGRSGESGAPTGRAAAAIVGGTEAPADGNVVALRFRDGALRCSATVIAPRVLLTAAHCGIHAGNFRAFEAFFGPSLGREGAVRSLLDARVHPGFVSATFANDLALVLLREDAPVAPKPRRVRAFSSADVGSALRFVGFGRSAASASDEGTRRQGVAPITEVSEAELAVAGGESQPCTYDSGGAAFATVDGIEQLAAVVSRGDSACGSYTRFARVDTQATFIDAYLAELATARKKLGERCLSSPQCESGLCIPAQDDPSIWSCSKPCASDAECGPLRCLANRCVHPLPTPGAAGSSCASDVDCVDAPCLAGNDGKLRCAPGCSPSDTRCPVGLRCQSVGPIRFACFPAERPPEASPSCSLSRARAGAFPALALLALTACRTRRRRS
jgi:hypothetical protein